ncbi:MAG: metallophosphoesterase [Cyanobacteria bacterium P01_F01_bin.42]
MPKFLHLADIHLGFDKYGSKERTKDFYHAFSDALERYAIAPQVDFVIIAGDLFEDRQVMPAVLNQAQICLLDLKESGIPVFAIEGNHDYRLYGNRTSWLQYLADWEHLIFLEPDEDGTLAPWDDEAKTGGYYDLDCGVRIIGSQWYGASAPAAILKLAEQISTLPEPPQHTVMMFHHGLEGYVSRSAGALRYQEFLPLKEVGVDYLALGHIHKAYEEQGWIFNPGSTEANSITENQAENPRGVYLVNLTETGIEAELKRDFQQRPIVRLGLKMTAQETPDEFFDLVYAQVQQAVDQGKTQDAIVELKISGRIGFDRLDVNVKELQAELKEMSEALIFLFKYDVTHEAYSSYLDSEEALPPRAEIERSIFQDFVGANARYREQTQYYTQGLIDLKEKALQAPNDAELYGLVESLLSGSNKDTQRQET